MQKIERQKQEKKAAKEKKKKEREAEKERKKKEKEAEKERRLQERRVKRGRGQQNTRQKCTKIIVDSEELDESGDEHEEYYCGECGARYEEDGPSVVKAWVGLTAAKIACAVRVCTWHQMLCNCGLLNTATLMFTFA